MPRLMTILILTLVLLACSEEPGVVYVVVTPTPESVAPTPRPELWRFGQLESMRTKFSENPEGVRNEWIGETVQIKGPMGHVTYNNNDDVFLHWSRGDWSRGGWVYQVKCLYDDPRLNPSGYELVALDNKDPQAEITIKGAIGRIHSSYERYFQVALSDCRATLPE